MSNVEAKLTTYLERSKFADPDAWHRRGLNPSSPDVMARMEVVVNDVCSSALKAFREGQSQRKMKAALIGALRRYRAGDFDTEDREFIASEVNSIAKMVGVGIGPELNSWLYGPFLGFIVNRMRNQSA